MMETQSKVKTKDLCDPDFLAQAILADEFIYDPGGEGLKVGAWTLRSWRDEFYRWQDGCWLRLSDAEIKRIVVEYIQKLNRQAVSYADEQQIPITTYRINNILLCLTGRIGIPESTEINTWPDGGEKIYHTIAVNNGLLLLPRDGGQPSMLSHTPDFFSVTKLPFDYEPDAKCPQWLKFLNEVMQGDKGLILLLQQWLGYLFRQGLQQQKFLLCCGEGSNGKTVFFEVVQALVGKDNVSEVPLCRYAHPFSLYHTLGKVVNMTHESSSFIEDEAETILKSYVSGDTLQFERKFREPVFTVPTAKVMIATNALPRFNDKTRAIWRRILLVPFDKVIPDDVQIIDLADRLKTELSGILNWTLEGLQKLNEAGRFTESDKSKELIEEYRRDADPARAFLLENYTMVLDGEGTGCAGIFETYVQYCDRNKCRPMNNRTFGRQVKRAFPDAERVQIGGRGSQQWIYQGLVNR